MIEILINGELKHIPESLAKKYDIQPMDELMQRLSFKQMMDFCTEFVTLAASAAKWKAETESQPTLEK